MAAFLSETPKSQSMRGAADALAAAEQAIALDPDNALAQFHRADILRRHGRFDEAIAGYRTGLTQKPDHVDALVNLGNTFGLLGRLDEAAASFQKALALAPDNAAAHCGLGDTLGERGRLDDAAASFRRALDIAPDYVLAHCRLGDVLRKRRRPAEAAACFRTAIELAPDTADAHDLLGTALSDLGRSDDAIDSFSKAIALAPDFARAHYNLGMLYEQMTRLTDAENAFRKALELAPNSFATQIYLAVVMRRRGNFADAIAHLEQVPAQKLSPRHAMRLHFELGKLYDLQNVPDQAFAHFSLGNELQAKTLPKHVDAARARDNVVQTARVFTPDVLERVRAVSGDPAPETPVFLVGFPRSGTTLLDQILDGHPALQVMEEKPALANVQTKIGEMAGGYPAALFSLTDDDLVSLRELYVQNVAQYIDHRSGAVLIDKLPLNIRRLPLIARLFPQARIIHALRHPYDVVLSCFMQSFDPNDAMANFFTIEDTVRFYDQVMGFWLQCTDVLPLRVHTVRYEDLVANFESEVRGLVRFLDVAWDATVLDFQTHAQQRGRIRTPSYQQVTQPLYRRASYRWKRYTAHLEPAINSLQSFVDAFGYKDRAPTESG